MPVNGLLNQLLNWSWLAKTAGMRKCIRLHSSIRSFWSGVPVCVFVCGGVYSKRVLRGVACFQVVEAVVAVLVVVNS